jgi:hypothetical protein
VTVRYGSVPRFLSFLGIVATLLMLVGIGGQAPAAFAQPAATAAGCTDANGVSVVVDLRQLGGGILERCAAGLGAGGTGLDALSRAGIPYQGTSQWGDSFICRLLGRPAADESLHIPGNSNYHEQCITTPPATAYWAYWWAPNGGSWRYSGAGVSSHRVTPGGFEGWVFTLGNADSQTPPGVAPVRATTVPATAASASPAAQPDPNKSQPASIPTSSGAPTQHSTATQPPSGTTTSSAPSPAAAAPSGAASPSSASVGAADALVSSNINAVGGRTPSHSSGISTGAILGACLLAFLATIGAGTAWRQARARRQT